MMQYRLDREFQSSAGNVAFGSAGEGEDVVLVHGTPTRSLIWREIVERLAPSYRVHWLDLPGYGASEKFAGQDVRLRVFARALREFIEHVGLVRPHLVGHDFGAATVLGAHLIEKVPVASLAVADGVVLNPWGTPFSLHVKEHESVFANVPDYIHRAVLSAHLATAVARRLPNDLEEELISSWTGEDGQPAYYRQVALYDHSYTAELETLYPGIDVPMLILWGEQDGWVDIEVGRRLNTMIPQSQMETLPDAGHFSMLDSPGLFARVLDNWLSSRTDRGK
ncbi:alpha/beta hydrolase [Shinella sp.]|uniref:alpha/beta fold hydrolase n=1 Tax=Shinella sp. TaxID=1870904 RepID=UPI0025901EE0|nr:alpha/beta hydrolase [Shinella sp.]MCW5711966.1 alpha/beta hydrolase [Shinella sp.]